MCKETIEKEGSAHKLSKVNWNKKTKFAVIRYDSMKTNLSEILKRIALAGYDNELFLAPNDVYSNLPECCQYQRELKPNANSSKKGHGSSTRTRTSSATRSWFCNFQ